MRTEPFRPLLAGGLSLLLTGGTLFAAAGDSGGAGGAGPEAMPQATKLQVGDRAPAFPAALPSTAGDRPGAQKIALAEVLGKKNIVLAFYVADWTGG